MCAEGLKGLCNKSLLKQLNSMQHSNYCFNCDLVWILEKHGYICQTSGFPCQWELFQEGRIIISRHQNKLEFPDLLGKNQESKNYG